MSFREWRRQYPASLTFHTRQITHRADLVVVESLISYDGAPWMYTVNLLVFRGDRVAHERIYIMDGWDPPEWRTPWRAERSADPAPPPSLAIETLYLTFRCSSSPGCHMSEWVNHGRYRSGFEGPA